MLHPVIIQFRAIEYGTADYEAEYRLRNAVLRHPLGMDLSDEYLGAERDQLHFGLFSASGDLLATVIAVPGEENTARIRQMAVTMEWAGRGLGSHLMREVEKQLIQQGIRRIELHARRSAERFYLKLGYRPEGTEFQEIGLPHILMVKEL